jgi:geranylgeranyl diphosphate synthase type I
VIATNPKAKCQEQKRYDSNNLKLSPSQSWAEKNYRPDLTINLQKADNMSDIDSYFKEKAPLIDETIKKYIPRHFSKRSIVFKICKPEFSHNIEALDKALAAPIWDLLEGGGKRWRPTLFLLICEAFGKDPKKFIEYAIIPEVVHNGTLLIDDIEDASELRRRKPCGYKMFGVDIAINTGNAMYYLPLLSLITNQKKLRPDVSAKLYQVYATEMISLHFGQAMDISWHKGLANADEIGENDYLQMCAYKTGTLARMAAKLAAVLSDAREDQVEKLGRFAETIGVAFQIQDDLLDLTSIEFAEKKGGRGMDITEGKRTLMVIHTLKKANISDRNRLISILNMHTIDQKLRDEAIAIMEKYKSIDYSRQYASSIVEESWCEVEELLPKSEAKNILKSFGVSH